MEKITRPRLDIDTFISKMIALAHQRGNTLQSSLIKEYADSRCEGGYTDDLLRQLRIACIKDGCFIDDDLRLEESYSELQDKETYLVVDGNKIKQFKNLDKANKVAQDLGLKLYSCPSKIFGTSKSWKLIKDYTSSKLNESEEVIPSDAVEKILFSLDSEISDSNIVSSQAVSDLVEDYLVQNDLSLELKDDLEAKVVDKLVASDILVTDEEIVKCSWCEEEYPKSDCQKEKDMGWLCDHCQRAIESRGTKLEFDDDPDGFYGINESVKSKKSFPESVLTIDIMYNQTGSYGVPVYATLEVVHAEDTGDDEWDVDNRETFDICDGRLFLDDADTLEEYIIDSCVYEAKEMNNNDKLKVIIKKHYRGNKIEKEIIENY